MWAVETPPTVGCPGWCLHQPATILNASNNSGYIITWYLLSLPYKIYTMSCTFNLALPVAIGSDHAGFDYKVELAKYLQQKGFDINDLGVYENKSVDYPDFAHPVADAVEKEEAAFGILVCGSGNGVCMTANKHRGIRAAVCWQPDIARLARQHNNANIICIPGRFVDLNDAKKMVDIFLETPFEGGRHKIRIDKISYM